MKQDVCTSIMIVYDQQKHIEINYLIAFWKWLGVMITERSFQTLPFLTEKLQQECKFFDYIFVVGILPEKFYNYFKQGSVIYAEEIFSLKKGHSQIDEWIKNYTRTIFSCNNMDCFVDLYRKYNCYKMDLIMELNHKGGILTQLEEETKFENWKIIDQLNKLIIENKELRIMENKKLCKQNEKKLLPFFCYNRYIEASCMHKVNLLCDELKYNYYYSPEMALEKLRAIIDLVPNFRSAYTMVVEISKTANFWADIGLYYRKALTVKPSESGMGVPYLSDPYLDFKRYREKRDQCLDINELIGYCQKAYEFDPINYKAYFQYAGMMIDLNKTRTAIQNYEKTIKMINLLSPLNQISLGELDYMLRSCMLTGLIYYQKWSDPLMEKYWLEQAWNIREIYLANNLFSEYYFNDHRDYFKKKILTKTNYIF